MSLCEDVNNLSMNCMLLLGPLLSTTTKTSDSDLDLDLDPGLAVAVVVAAAVAVQRRTPRNIVACAAVDAVQTAWFRSKQVARKYEKNKTLCQV